MDDFRAAVPDFRVVIPDFRAVIPDFRAVIPDFRAAIPDFRAVIPDFPPVIPAKAGIQRAANTAETLASAICRRALIVSGFVGVRVARYIIEHWAATFQQPKRE